MSQQDRSLKNQNGISSPASAQGSALEGHTPLHSQWLEALPRHFAFYHLGDVALENLDASEGPESVAPRSEIKSEDHFAIGFGFHGDLRGLLVILLDKGLDLSTYSELGNILAAKIATELSNNGGLDVMISPPYSLSPERLKEILAAPSAKTIRRAYLHQQGDLTVRVEAFVLPAESTEFGNA